MADITRLPGPAPPAGAGSSVEVAIAPSEPLARSSRLRSWRRESIATSTRSQAEARVRVSSRFPCGSAAALREESRRIRAEHSTPVQAFRATSSPGNPPLPPCASSHVVPLVYGSERVNRRDALVTGPARRAQALTRGSRLVLSRVRLPMAWLSDQLGRGVGGAGRGGWVMDQTYAATARTSSSGMFDHPRIGIGLPVQVSCAGIPRLICSTSHS